MRKFTLFFMSMFLVLGTAMAKDEEPVEFTLQYMTPQDGAKVTSVYNVIMGFTKEVTATLPEEGISIVNNETQEVVKITRIYSDEWSPKNQVTFLFEQETTVGKEGKEELCDKIIETPGTYSYTIPAGAIKSVDGDEFAGGTYTFSIVSTFSHTDYSPKETASLEKIELTFEQEIIEVKMPTNGLVVTDYYWSQFFNIKNDVTISDDKKTVTLELETPITTPGQYFLELYQGVFISTDGISNGANLSFNVIDPTPRFETNYKNGDKVKVGELKNFEISFKNVETVELKKTEFTVLSLSAQSAITGTAAYSEETGKITVTLSQELTQDGDYVFQIPAGMFTMDGMENEKRDVQINIFTFTIAPLEVVSVTPAVGKVDQIANITITFNQPVQLYYDKEGVTLSSQIVLKSGENEYVLYSNYSNDLASLIYTTDEWTGTDWAANPITAEGAYTLDLSTIVVNYGAEDGIDEYGYPAKIWHAQNYSLAGTYTWTIGGSDEAAAKFVNAETAEQVIYDLLGRRVEKVTTAGIYIVNGRKVIIK